MFYFALQGFIYNFTFTSDFRANVLSHIPPVALCVFFLDSHFCVKRLAICWFYLVQCHWPNAPQQKYNKCFPFHMAKHCKTTKQMLVTSTWKDNLLLYSLFHFNTFVDSWGQLMDTFCNAIMVKGCHKNPVWHLESILCPVAKNVGVYYSWIQNAFYFTLLYTD